MFLLLEIDIFACAVFAFLVMVIAYGRYKQRGSQLTKTIFYMFISISLIILSSGIVFLLDYLKVPLGPFSLIPTICMLIAIYFLFVFARIVFAGEQRNTKLDKLVKVMFAIGIALCVLRDFFLADSISYLFINVFRYLWLEAFALISVIPVIAGGLYLRKKVPKDDPHRAQISAILVMAILFFIADITFLLDGVMRIVFTLFPSVISFLTWILLYLALYASYRGFFSKEKESRAN